MLPDPCMIMLLLPSQFGLQLHPPFEGVRAAVKLEMAQLQDLQGCDHCQLTRRSVARVAHNLLLASTWAKCVHP